VHIQLPAEEEDGDAVEGEAAEAPCTCFDRLDFAVESFGHGVRNFVRTMRKQSADVPLEHLRHLDHGDETGVGRPEVPTRKKRTRRTLTDKVPEMPKRLLEHPSATDLEFVLHEDAKAFPFILGEVVFEKEILRPFQKIVARFHSGAMLRLANRVHRLAQIRSDVELIVHNRRV